MTASLVLPDLRGGGAGRVMLNHVHQFARAGHAVKFVLTPAEGDFLPEAKRHFSVFDMKAPRSRNVPVALVRYLSRRRRDGVLAATWPLTVIAPLAARMSGFRGKIVISEHEMLTQQYAPRGELHRFALRASAFAGYRLASIKRSCNLLDLVVMRAWLDRSGRLECRLKKASDGGPVCF